MRRLVLLTTATWAWRCSRRRGRRRSRRLSLSMPVIEKLAQGEAFIELRVVSAEQQRPRQDD